MNKSFQKIGVSLLSLLIALIVGTVVILICGYDPLSAYSAMLEGSLGTWSSALYTLEKSVPLILCGLSAAAAMKSGMFNIGIEGQLYMGALGYALGGLFLGFLPKVFLIPVCLALGVLFGAGWAYFPAMFRVRFGTNEVVTTIMLTHVAQFLISYLVTAPLSDGSTVPQSDPISANAVIGKIAQGGTLTWGILIAVLLCAFIWVLFERTTTGYSITAAGMNPRAAEAGGIRPDRARLQAMLLSGALAGLAGALLVSSTFGRLVQQVSDGYGYDGIAIAVLGQFSPVGILLGSLLFSTLHTGSLYMEMFSGIPSEAVSVLQGVVILVIAAPHMIQELFKRREKACKASSR